MLLAEDNQMSINKNIMLKRFPPIAEAEEHKDKLNPAIRLYGRRFYKDQTPLEYLAEFLLVFASPKSRSENQNNAYSLSLSLNDGFACYWPEDHVALKLFSFFPSSKLETRHPVHQKNYLQAIDAIKARIPGSDEEQNIAVRLIQSLFFGFVGVAKARTWVTYTFLPASVSLLAREVTWNHPAAVKRSKKIEVTDWDSSTEYFDSSTHNFMGRGGELLFLQLVNLFSNENLPDIDCNIYHHLYNLQLSDLRDCIESSLRKIINESIEPLGELVNFIESSLIDYKLPQKKGNETRLGWVPSVTRPEALLFATELKNICTSTVGSLEKLELLQLLCTMQVLRSLCFQACRIIEYEIQIEGFMGNYAWIITDPKSDSGMPMRKIAQKSLERIESLLFRAIRSPHLGIVSAEDLKNGDDNCFRLFRKFAKELGLVIPLTGRGQRFVLPPHLLRFLVAALLAPGERVRLTEFYARTFAHYGIALGDRQLAAALAWSGNESGNKDYAVAADTAWIEEALQQGGFLVELSDAVSIVHNPGGKEQRA